VRWSPEELRAAQLLWATVDSPWVHAVDRRRYAASLEGLRALEEMLAGFAPAAG
jgi:hypothetical protein